MQKHAEANHSLGLSNIESPCNWQRVSSVSKLLSTLEQYNIYVAKS